MNRVGGGDLEAKAEFGGSTEFRRLADALNRMIGELRDRLQPVVDVVQLLAERREHDPGVERVGQGGIDRAARFCISLFLILLISISLYMYNIQ